MCNPSRAVVVIEATNAREAETVNLERTASYIVWRTALIKPLRIASKDSDG